MGRAGNLWGSRGELSTGVTQGQGFTRHGGGSSRGQGGGKAGRAGYCWEVAGPGKPGEAGLGAGQGAVGSGAGCPALAMAGEWGWSDSAVGSWVVLGAARGGRVPTAGTSAWL